MDDLLGRLMADKPKDAEPAESSSDLSQTQADSQDSEGGWLTNKSLSGAKKKTKMLECYDTAIPKDLQASKLVWARNDRFSKKALKGSTYNDMILV